VINEGGRGGSVAGAMTWQMEDSDGVVGAVMWRKRREALVHHHHMTSAVG